MAWCKSSDEVAKLSYFGHPSALGQSLASVEVDRH